MQVARQESTHLATTQRIDDQRGQVGRYAVSSLESRTPSEADRELCVFQCQNQKGPRHRQNASGRKDWIAKDAGEF